jgi:hypothetical protein
MATPKPRVTFTALPNGVTGTGSSRKLRLSVFVSPRLNTDPPTTGQMDLSQFPDWVNWPSTPVTYQVSFGGAPAVAATPVGDGPIPALWSMLFDGTTKLTPREFETTLAGTKIPITYPVKDVYAKIQEIYTYFAKNSPEEHPSVTQIVTQSPLKDLVSLFTPAEKPQHVCPAGQYWNGTKCDFIITGVKGPELASLIAAPQVQQDFKKVADFHKPFNPDNRITPAPPQIDFHQMLSALGRYPFLMRQLGIVRDLEAAYPGPLNDTTVQVIASWPTKASSTVPEVLTNCHVGETTFYARRRTVSPELTDDGLGMLPFDDASEYDVVQVNQDGAVLKTLNFVSQVTRATFAIDDPVNYPEYELKPDLQYPSGNPKVYKTEDTPTEYAIPAVQSIGISVARIDHAAKTQGNLSAQVGKNNALEAGSVTFDAEDLTRGYAIDVYDDKTQMWHSLNERVGTYELSETTLAGIEDEGWVSTGLAKPADGSSADAKLQETLFNWWGWSLSAPRPGKTMDKDGNPAYTQSQPTGQFNLSVDFDPMPGSLPKLRYGTSYRLRARAVDLAGNRTPRAAVTDFTHASPAVTYGRFDPVASPDVVLDKPLGEGDARDRIVIRSNYNSAADTATRHIAPPKAAETMAETLGNLDATNGGLDADAYKLLAQKDGGSWTDIGKPDPNNPGVVYVTEHSSAILPYLPDLLARGATLRELPGSAAAVKVPFYDMKTWPDALPFDLVLSEGAAAPNFQSGPRDLNVQLGKGDVARIRLSSYMEQADVERMGLLRWLEANSSQAEVDSFRQRVYSGIHWMVTPFRKLTLVHAVRQPLLRPKYNNLKVDPDRQLGDTFAALHDDAFELSRKSTTRIDIVAQWSETLDPLGRPGPIVAQTNAKPFQVKVPLDPAHETTLDLKGQHEFGDTKYRKVMYSAHATSRFAEYFAERKEKMQVHAGQKVVLHPPVTDEGVTWGGVVEGSETVTAADRTTKYVRDIDYTMDYGAGTFTAAAGIDGKMVVITYVPTPIVRTTAGQIPLDILSTARPAAPKVLYLIPTFGWNSSANQEGTNYTSERKGGGLRAYLERPWFSSGDGELLGVVIWAGTQPPADDIKPYVSDWALDPMYKSAPTTAAPALGAFKLATPATSKTSGLTLEELPATTDTFHVAGHPVGYDAERKLWYCDIEIDAGLSYLPMVRLALARYQPNSVPSAHLSRVVLADFVQLTANRTASLTRPSKQSDTLNVAVSGLSYSKLTGTDGASIVEVSIEQQRPNAGPDAGELAWDQVPASTKTLTVGAGPGGTIWTGQVTLPKGPPGRFRVVIQEFERFGPTASDRRLVYADAIVVDR